MSRLILIISGLLFINSFLFNCNTVSGQLNNTNAGTNFWFGFPYNADEGSVTYAITITSFYSTSGTISVPGTGFTQPFNITSGAVYRFVMTPSDVMVNNPDVIANNAVHVTSGAPIALYFSEEALGPRNDNSSVLPNPVLGNDYYIMSYADFGSTSEFMVIAPGSTVRIEVTPAAASMTGHQAGVSFDTTLQSGQVFQLQSSNDLTGSRVRALDSTQSFAVIGANALGSVSCDNTVDPMFEQSLPLTSWGMNYVVVSTPNSDDVCRVLASQNGTTVNINGSVVATLNAGQYYDQVVTQSSPFFVTANNPISIARILQTESCNNNPLDVGDPDMILVDANEQMYLDSITFYANNVQGITVNYVQVVVRSQDVNTVLLDGSNISSLFTTLTANPAYSYADITIQAGYHQIITNGGLGFLAYMVGLGHVTSTGCAAAVYIIPATVKLAMKVTPTHCAASNDTATVTVKQGKPPYAYLWSPGGQTTQSVIGLTAGTYIVTVTDAAGKTASDTAIIAANPNADFSFTPICVNDTVQFADLSASDSIIVSWKWYFGDGDSSSAENPSHYYSYIDTFHVMLDVEISAGCMGKDTLLLAPAGFAFKAGPDTSICWGNQVQLNANGGINYAWQPDSALDNDTISNPLSSTTNTITYTVLITNASGCTESTIVSINVNALPVITAGDDTTICSGNKVQLNANGGVDYSWQPDSSLNSGDISNPLASPAANVTYTVLITNASGCTRSTTVSINVNALPVIIASDDTTICSNYPLTLFATGAVNYQWYSSSSIICNNCSSVNVPTTGPGVYTVDGTDINGCTGTAQVSVSIEACDDVFMPTAFSPNGDGINDVFLPIGVGVTHIVYSIYNRWGELIFTGNDLINGWDGKYRGENESIGVYVWQLSATFNNGTSVEKKGNVTLLR